MDVGLARVSTLDQDPRLQITALERAGCDPILEERVSGASEKRPVRDRALRMLQRGDTLTTWKLDRLGRSVIDLHTVVADLKARGVAWRSLTEQIDTTHAQGELFFAILAAFAQFERALIIERTTAAKQAMIGDGRHPGGPRAFGFAADHTTIVEAEAELLREAARRVLAREPAGVSGIVDAWNQRDVPSASGGRWVVTSLRRQLVNPRSIPILGAQTHRELVKLFSDAGRRRMGAPATHLLSGILRCGSCEQWLYGGHVQGDRWVYRCRKTSGGRFKGCGTVSISLPRADEWVTEAFVVAVAGDGFARAIAARQAAVKMEGSSAEQLGADRDELGELEMILPTRYATAVHRARHGELRASVRAAEAALASLPEVGELASLPRTEQRLRAAWDAWTVAERRVWLRRVLRHVDVAPAPAGSHHRGSDVGARLDPSWKL